MVSSESTTTPLLKKKVVLNHTKEIPQLLFQIDMITNHIWLIQKIYTHAIESITYEL